MEIATGARFDSYDAFDTALRHFQVQTNTLFVKKTSKSIDVVNAHLSREAVKLDSKLRFSNATFTCKHGGRHRTNATGVRPNQRTMKKDCPVKLVLAARRATQQLEITALNLQHNHEVSIEIYKAYPECRRLATEELSFVQPLMELNVPPSMIVQKLKEQSGKTVIAKDLHNLKRATRTEDEASLLVAELKHCQATYGARVLSITDENKELQILFIQTPHMQQAFRSFPEVVLLDATYRTNKLRMPLYVMAVQDGSGSTQVIAYAFVASEQQHVVNQLLETFVQENPAAADTQVVVVDKDFTEINAIRTTFPSSPAVQLCQFHVTKAFKSAAGQLAKSSDERERLLSSFNEMLLSPTPARYNDAKAEFERYASEEAVSYFAKNWGNIPEMWVRHLCDRKFTGGNNTTNRVESHHAKLKNVLASSSKLHETVRNILKMSSSMQQEACHKTILLKTCEFYSHQESEGVEKECAKVLTPYACKIIKQELAKMQDDPPEVRIVSEQTYAVASSCTDAWHEVSLDNHACSCTTYSKMKLLCRHFLYVCVKFGIKPDLTKAVHKRWFKSYQLKFMGGAVETNSEAANHEAPEILSMPGPSFEKMNRNQRYNYALRALKALVDNMADCQPDVFAERLAFLESVNASWLKRDASFTHPHNEDEIVQADSASVLDILPTTSSVPHEVGQLPSASPVSQKETEQPCGRQTDSCTSDVRSQPCSSRSACDLKLPEVKSRGRPCKRVLQNRYKRAREADEEGPVAFKSLSEKAKAKLLLAGFSDKALCDRVLNGTCQLDEADIEVRPEALPSALLDCRVSLPKLKKYCTPDAWSLLTASVAVKKKNALWICGLCKEKDDGALKMVCCDRCLEWFHWCCAAVTSADLQKQWFCTQCKGCY
ncbi:uncharacterized protein [Dermacentor albipictus]|uniref:uncharacterized protein n=1 Tax=Dermacentor albipictus TaxID=60249 RepID=UPI0031FCCD5D